MNIREAILELERIAGILGDTTPVRIEHGGEEHEAKTVTFEGNTNEMHVIIHG